MELLEYLDRHKPKIKLDARKKEELNFHNEHRKQNAEVQGNKKFYSTTSLSNEYIINWVAENSPGRVFLDYACGNGGYARLAALSGAKLALGIDISDVSIENCRQNSRDFSNLRFIQADCENTGFPNNSVDIIFCSGMLHHLDLNLAFPEMKRILAPGGKILGIEALSYNPIIQWYRNRTPEMRTEWEKEHILSYKELDLAAKYFNVRNIKHWHLFSILGAYTPLLLPVYNAIDNVVLQIPGIKLMSWMFTFELHKKSPQR